VEIGHRHWTVALLTAALLQVALAAALYRPHTDRAAGLSGGVEIALGTTSGRSAETGEPYAADASEAVLQSTPDLQPPTDSPADPEPIRNQTDARLKEEESSVVTSPSPSPETTSAAAVARDTKPDAPPEDAAKKRAKPPAGRKREPKPAQKPVPPRSGIARQSADADRYESSVTTAAATSKAGDDAGTPTSGAGGGGTAAAVSPDYYRSLAAWLEKHKRYPRRAVQRRQQGVVKVSFKIDRQGNLLSRQIISSSGYRLLDEAADSLLLRASPMPGIPRQSTAQVLEVIVPIMYALR
jgi:periplasmic protein TonB